MDLSILLAGGAFFGGAAIYRTAYHNIKHGNLNAYKHMMFYGSQELDKNVRLKFWDNPEKRLMKILENEEKATHNQPGIASWLCGDDVAQVDSWIGRNMAFAKLAKEYGISESFTEALEKRYAEDWKGDAPKYENWIAEHTVGIWKNILKQRESEWYTGLKSSVKERVSKTAELIRKSRQSDSAS